MATSALHRELGVPARTQVTFELLSSLAKKGIREQSDLDFKQKLYHPEDEKQKQELVKDVCAMANTGGGWIVCGIAEKNSAAAEILGVDVGRTSETDVHQMLENRLDPPLKVVDIRVYESEDQKKTLVAIRIPDSPDKPHLVRVTKSEGQKLVDTKAFRVPLRRGASTVWLDEREIRDSYRKSFNIIEKVEKQKTQHLDKLSDQVAENFPSVALALVLTPHDPLSGKPDKHEIQRLLREIDLGRFASNLKYSFLEEISTPLSVGDLCYIGTQTAKRYHALIDIGFNGAIAIAIQLSVNEPDMGPGSDHLYTNQPDETTQRDVECALIDAFNCASQLSNSLNPASDSELHIHLIPYKENPIVIRRNEARWAGSLIRPRSESTPIKRFRTVSRTLQANPTSAEEHEILTELIDEVLNQGGIETTYVIEPLHQPEDETP